MTDVYVAYDQLEDAYLPVRLQQGTWTYVHGVEEATYDSLPALSGKDRYRALADVYEVDRDFAVKRATRALRKRSKQLKQWGNELEEFLAVSAVRHARQERELAELAATSKQLITDIIEWKQHEEV